MHGNTSPPGCSTQLEREYLADERNCREPRKHADFLGGPAALAVCTFLLCAKPLALVMFPGDMVSFNFLHMLGYLIPWKEAPLSNGQLAIRHPGA